MATAAPDVVSAPGSPAPSTAAALIVVDMQGAFCASTGSLCRLGIDTSPLRDAVDGCRRLIDAARAAGVPVIFTVLAYRDDYADAGRSFREVQQPVTAIGGLIRGSPDTAVLAQVDPAPGEVVIDKQHSDAFRGTNLDVIIRARCVDDVVVCGVTTAVCVAATARSAAELGYRTWIVADATAETSQELHHAALEVFTRAYGYVTGTASIIAAWRAPSETGRS